MRRTAAFSSSLGRETVLIGATLFFCHDERTMWFVLHELEFKICYSSMRLL